MDTLGQRTQRFQILNDVAILGGHHEHHQILDRLVHVAVQLQSGREKYRMLLASTKVCCLFVSPISFGKTARMPYSIIPRERNYFHAHAIHIDVLSGNED